jgi:hypothetical protein
MMTRLIVHLLFVLCAAATARGAEPVPILPSDTDHRISKFNSPHLAWLPEGRARNQLLLFLPGTGGSPENGLFHSFAATAAGLGYHVVGLMYHDNLAAQKKCSQSDDPDAYLKFRKRFFAYNHVRDNGNGCNHEQQMKVLRQIGLPDLGIADADNPQPSYGHARVLYTNVDLENSTRFHSSVLKGSLGVNPPVWKYMLTEPVD